MRKLLLLLLAMPLTMTTVDAQVRQEINPDCPELALLRTFTPQVENHRYSGLHRRVVEHQQGGYRREKGQTLFLIRD